MILILCNEKWVGGWKYDEIEYQKTNKQKSAIYNISLHTFKWRPLKNRIGKMVFNHIVYFLSKLINLFFIALIRPFELAVG